VTIRMAFLFLLMATNAIAQQSSGNTSTKASRNASIDPEHIFFTQPVKGPITDVSEPVKGSDIPLHLYLCGDRGRPVRADRPQETARRRPVPDHFICAHEWRPGRAVDSRMDAKR